MKVLHVLPFPGVGGTEIATRRIADTVREFGVESRALLLDPTDDLVAYLEDAGIPCVVPRTRPEPSFRAAVRFLQDSRAMAMICREVDLIHCADIQAAYYVAFAGRLARRPILSHVRNRHSNIPQRNRFFINASTHFAFVSRSTRNQFSAWISDARATTVYDAVESVTRSELMVRDDIAAAVRAELNLPADACIASMFARVNPQKDYETLVRAGSILSDSHPLLRFVIVGDNSNIPLNRGHYDHVKVLVAAAGLENRFIFTGFRTDVRRIMLASNLCVLSTHFEGLPLVLLEAMALARPCVATAVDGVSEVLNHGTTGLLHDHEDASGLAGHVASLLDNPQWGDQIGCSALKEVQERFGIERFGREMCDLYSRLAGQKKAAGRMLKRSAPIGHATTPNSLGSVEQVPSISVVIPAFNAERTLTDAIKSVLLQTIEPAEIIVVDDGSSDATAAIAQAHPKVTLLQQSNRGCGEARNTGARTATGEWLAFLDADDLWLPQKLEKQVTFTKDARVAVVNCRRHDKHGDALGDEISFDQLWQQNELIVSSTLVRRSAFGEIGGFWSERYCEDYHLWLRLASQGWKIANCTEDLVIYSPAPGSLSQQVEHFAATEVACIAHVARLLKIPDRQLNERLVAAYTNHARGAIYTRNLDLAKTFVRESLALGFSIQQIKILTVAHLPVSLLNVRRRIIHRRDRLTFQADHK